MVALMEVIGFGRMSQPLAVFDNVDAGMKYVEEKFDIILMERDPDGHEAADIFTASGSLYVIQ